MFSDYEFTEEDYAEVETVVQDGKVYVSAETITRWMELFMETGGPLLALMPVQVAYAIQGMNDYVRLLPILAESKHASDVVPDSPAALED